VATSAQQVSSAMTVRSSVLSLVSAYPTYVFSFVLRAILASVGLGMPKARQIVLVTPRQPSLVPLRKPARKPAAPTANGTVTANGTDTDTTVNRFVVESCPSLKPEPGFKPSWWLNSGHLQTAYSVVGNFNNVDRVEYERKLIRLPDGGTV
jgi:hypothetical protein